MIIAIDASRANYTKKTGVEWYAFYIIEELKKHIPSHISVILYSQTPLSGALAKFPSNWQSSVLVWPPKRLWTHIRLSWQIVQDKPDVLFVPSHVPPLIHPKKTVTTIHDVAAMRFPKSYNWFEKWYSLWSAKYAVKHMWRIIVPSAFTKKELCCYTKKEDCGIVYSIPHGYDEGYKKPVEESKANHILQKHGVTKPFILSVGRIETKKNTIQTVQAFSYLKKEHKNQTEIQDLQLVLIGKPGFGYDGVLNAIVQSPYKKDIHILGWMPQNELYMFMQYAKVFVFPSIYEGFGMPLLEAFAAQTAVVAAKGNCLEEVGKDAALYVDPLETTEIADAIHTLVSSDKLTQTYIKKGNNVLRNYSWSICGKKTADILCA